MSYQNTCELESFHGFLHNMTIVFVFIFYILIQLLFSFLHVVQPRTVIACHPSFRPSFSPTSLLSSIKLKGERHIVSMWSIKKLTISVVYLLQIHAWCRNGHKGECCHVRNSVPRVVTYMSEIQDRCTDFMSFSDVQYEKR